MWGADLFRFPTFLPNLVSDKMSHFMKVTDNEGHHHLTFHIWIAHEFPYIYTMNFKLYVVGVHRLVPTSAMEIYFYF